MTAEELSVSLLFGSRVQTRMTLLRDGPWRTANEHIQCLHATG